MRVVRNILAASGVIGSLFASAGVKEVLLPERYVQGDVSAVRKIESAAFEKFADLAVVLPPEIRTHDISSYSTNNLDYAIMNGLAMTSGGRLWVSWITGGDSPDAFTVASRSDDGGLTWSDVELVIDGHGM